MATTIVTKYGSDAPAASDIVRGELAVDTENGRLYTENSSGAVVEIGLNPEGNVDVTGSVTADGLTVDGNDSYTSNIRFTYGSSAPTYFADWGYKSSSDGNKVFLTITDGGSAKDVLVANYNGNVGIGVAPSAAYKMQVAVATNTVSTGSPATGSIFNVSGGTTTVGDGVSLQLTNVSGAKETGWRISAVTASGNNGDLVFNGYAGGSDYPERMRLDSSGNLLVGTTTAAVANGTTAGIAATSGDQLLIGTSSDVSAAFNRIGTDGEILVFRRDGTTTVGSIGTEGGDLTIGSSASGHKGVRFGANYIAPINTSNAFEDNTTDLGLPAVRFKDLYLSGGAYLGGTAAANKLDDYEEGTWTPVTNSGSWTVNAGTYTKVGNMVTCRFKVTATATIASNDFTGLPFTPAGESAGVCGYQNSESGVVFSVLVQTSSVWNFRVGSTAKGVANNAIVSGMFTYRTTA